MKNYKKIYNRLIKEIKKELNAHDEHITYCPMSTNTHLFEMIESRYAITLLDWILSTLPEIEGRECRYIIMNEKEFKKWKKNIKS